MTTRERSTEAVTVTKASESEFTVDSGWSFSNREVGAKAGDNLLVETINFSRVVGVQNRDTGQWYYRFSDEDLDRQDRERREAFDRENRERLEANREDWERRTEALPDWILQRIRSFQVRGGKRFELDGWGYELGVAELAVLYAKHGVPAEASDDPQEIWDYAQREGTSGNQHNVARVLARMHLEGQGVIDTVSALTPLTGDPFYEGVSGNG